MNETVESPENEAPVPAPAEDHPADAQPSAPSVEAPRVAAAAEAATPDAPDAPDAPRGDPQTFDEMKLDPAVRQAVDEMGFELPMEVQTVIYNRAIAGADLMVQSRTGSGKTAAFGIPIAQNLSPGTSGVQALLLAPTRELALQVAQELARITAYRNLQVVPVYGGAPMGRQIEALRAGAQIVAGTPGRVLDHIRRGTLKTDKIRILVLDECDEMLSMGFQEEIEKILAELPPKDQRQTLLFSATIPEEIERIARRHMKAPEKVVLSADFVGVHEIAHRYYLVSGLGRTRDLLKILEFERPESAIVFCNTRDDTSVVAQFLMRNGYDAENLSSDLSQVDRERVMGRMRNKELKFLVATDIAARGIDISNLPFVVNYTFPESPEVYIHRTGRTGRAGATGTAISLIGPREIGSFYYLKLLYKIRPEERELPTEGEIKTRREGERYARLAERVPEDPGDEWRALARRVWESADGERLLAALVKRMLEGPPPPQVAAPQPPPPPRPRPRVEAEAETEAPPPRRERVDSVDRSAEPTPSPVLRADRPVRSERPRDERPRGRREGPPGRESRGDRRGERGERRRDDRPRSERPRSERPSSERPSSERPPSERPPSERPGIEGQPPDTAGDVIGREFWETWVDEKAQKPGAAAQAAAAPAAEGVVPPAREDQREPREPREPRERRPRREREPVPAEEPGYVKLYVNVGKREGLGAEDVTRLFSEALPDQAGAVGAVTVFPTHTYVSVKEEAAGAVVEGMAGKKVGERDLVVERAKPR